MTRSPALPHLDGQILGVRDELHGLSLPEQAWSVVASAIHEEVAGLGEEVINRLRVRLAIPPESYLDELSAFQAWMDIAHSNAANPVIVRAQVMTELYVAFVWLRDSLMDPLSEVISPSGVARSAIDFLRTGDRRRLRNAVAHGRWCYLSDFSGLECWDGRPPTRFNIGSDELEAWQLLSRGLSIAVLLAMTDSQGSTNMG